MIIYACRTTKAFECTTLSVPSIAAKIETVPQCDLYLPQCFTQLGACVSTCNCFNSSRTCSCSSDVKQIYHDKLRCRSTILLTIADSASILEEDQQTQPDVIDAEHKLKIINRPEILIFANGLVVCRIGRTPPAAGSFMGTSNPTRLLRQYEPLVICKCGTCSVISIQSYIDNQPDYVSPKPNDPYPTAYRYFDTAVEAVAKHCLDTKGLRIKKKTLALFKLFCSTAPLTSFWLFTGSVKGCFSRLKNQLRGSHPMALLWPFLFWRNTTPNEQGTFHEFLHYGINDSSWLESPVYNTYAGLSCYSEISNASQSNTTCSTDKIVPQQNSTYSSDINNAPQSNQTNSACSTNSLPSSTFQQNSTCSSDINNAPQSNHTNSACSTNSLPTSTFQLFKSKGRFLKPFFQRGVMTDTQFNAKKNIDIREWAKYYHRHEKATLEMNCFIGKAKACRLRDGTHPRSITERPSVLEIKKRVERGYLAPYFDDTYSVSARIITCEESMKHAHLILKVRLLLCFKLQCVY